MFSLVSGPPKLGKRTYISKTYLKIEFALKDRKTREELQILLVSLTNRYEYLFVAQKRCFEGLFHSEIASYSILDRCQDFLLNSQQQS